MANEAKITNSLQIYVGTLQYSSLPNQFMCNVSTARGPTPGAIAVSTNGTNVNLDALTTPGLCRIMNIGNYRIEWGIHDGSIFHPIGEVEPGESYIVKLSRNLGVEEAQTGTGTTGKVNHLYVRAVTAASTALIEVFEA